MTNQELRQAARRRLDQRLRRVSLDEIAAQPRLGWVRAIRDALGMSTRQLAARMGVAQTSVVQLERSEANGTIQLNSLRRAADALGCDVVYALVPREGSLEKVARSQALRRATAIVKAVDRTMELEDQAVDDEGENRAALDRAQLQLLASRRLWDD